MLTSVCMPLQKLKFISALWISAGWALFLRPGSGLESCWACHSLLALSTSGSCSLGLLPPGTTLCSVRLHALSKAWVYTFPGSFPGFQNSVVIPGTWVNNTLQDWVQRQQQCRDMSAAMILPCPIKHTIPIHLLLKVALKPWLEQAYRQGEAFFLEDPRNADCFHNPRSGQGFLCKEVPFGLHLLGTSCGSEHQMSVEFSTQEFSVLRLLLLLSPYDLQCWSKRNSMARGILSINMLSKI